MAMSDEQIEALFMGVDSDDRGRFAIVRLFARAIEAEVRKDYDALIRQMLEALENQCGQRDAEEVSAITAAKARLGGQYATK